VGVAGFGEVNDYATIGGTAVFHQFTRVGAYSMVSGASAVRKDVPPYALTGNNPVAFYILNIVGL
jgi:UDP-N-acetylglucosamine acyltransferase